MVKAFGLVILILHALVAFYFINPVFNFFTVPEFILKLNSYIIFVGVAFIILGGVRFLKGKESTRRF